MMVVVVSIVDQKEFSNYCYPNDCPADGIDMVNVCRAMLPQNILS